MSAWFQKNRSTLIVLAAALTVFWIGFLLAQPAEEALPRGEEYVEYETATVTQILTDSSEKDPVSENAYRGSQLILAKVTSGQYKGETLQVENYVGPLYGNPVKKGDSIVLTISTYEGGMHRATVYEFDRIAPLLIILAVFLLAAVLVGGRTGAKSLVGLLVTFACLFGILIPALVKGAPTLPTVFLVCAFIAVVTLTILGGIQKKTLCAMLGTVAGTLLALLFGLAAQALCRLDGLRLEDAEPLLQIRQTGGSIGIRGLLIGGVVISTLGAVMDVTMGISSALCEVRAADPSLGTRELFRSGMNIGRDMVGTMTNTLILALLGSSFSTIIYYSTIGLQTHELLSSPFLAVEVISSIACSIGVILSIPLTALITARMLATKKNEKP